MTILTISNLEKPSPRLLTTDYARAVLSGSIVASRKVMLACKRHLEDLERQGTEGFPFIFVEEKGHRPIRYIEKFCKPSKGKHDRITMQMWQHFCIGSLYGWVHKDTGLRRYTSGLIMVARKNGKSGIGSGLSVYSSSSDGERGADIYVLANSMKQVRKTIYDETAKMIKASPVLNRNFRVTRDAAYYDKTNSIIEPQASDSEKLDGLNTHLAIFDEIHEFKDYKLINIVENSTSYREQPLLLYITTAGYQLDGPLIDYYEEADQVLDGPLENDRMFYFIAELDSLDEIDDSSKWVKANPNLGVTIKLEKMQEEWAVAKRTPEKRTDYITKRFNIFSKADQQAYLDYETIQKNKKVINMDQLRGKTCTGAYDLSETEDFTSACLEFPLPETGEIFVLSHSWIPRKKVIAANEKIPYMEWAEQGLLTISDHDYIEYEMVYDWFIEQSKKYQIELITYDRANAFRLNLELEKYGFKTQKVTQGHLTLSPAMKDLKHLFLDGKVISNNNPLLRWYINNIQLVKDRNGNLMPTKQNRYRKIDGFAALLNAHTNVMTDLTAPVSTGNVKVWSIKELMGR